MKNAAGLLSVALLVVSSASVQGPDARQDLRSLIQAELDFARASRDKGLRQAFLEFLAAEAVVFRPRPVPGRPVYEALPADSDASLDWKPAFAEISRAGDLGYTTGPYEFRSSRSDAASAGFGHYVTVWKKQDDGSWKAVIDAGISHPAPATTGEEVQTLLPGAPAAHLLTASELDQETRALLARDRELGKLASGKDLAAAYLSIVAEQARFYRDRAFPVEGREAMLKLLSERAFSMRGDPVSGGMSASGDLAYTYGLGRSTRPGGGPEAGFSYLRLWRMIEDEPSWRLVLEVAVEFGLE